MLHYDCSYLKSYTNWPLVIRCILLKRLSSSFISLLIQTEHHQMATHIWSRIVIFTGILSAYLVLLLAQVSSLFSVASLPLSKSLALPILAFHNNTRFQQKSVLPKKSPLPMHKHYIHSTSHLDFYRGGLLIFAWCYFTFSVLVVCSGFNIWFNLWSPMLF